MGHKIEVGKILNDTYQIDGYYLNNPQLMSLYVVKGNKTALIDSGVSQSAGKVIESLKQLGLFPVDYIVITHEHADHIQGLAPLVKVLGKKVKVYASKTAQPMIEDPSKIGFDFGMGPIEPVKNITPLDEGDAVDLGGVELKVVSIPGHTPGHIALYDKSNRNIFVGDSIGYKIDENTFLPPIIPPRFNKEQFYASLDKLKKIKFDSICVAHYGLWDGSDAKKILDEAKTVFDNYWNFFEENIDKLDDFSYISKSLIQKYLSKSKEKDRPGKSLITLLFGMREGFKYANKLE